MQLFTSHVMQLQKKAVVVAQLSAAIAFWHQRWTVQIILYLTVNCIEKKT